MGLSLASAFDASIFGSLPQDIRAQILQGAMTRRYIQGKKILGWPHRRGCVIVLNGRLRVSVASSSGRKAVLRYAPPGDIVGLIDAILELQNITAEAASDCEVVFLNVATLQALAKTEPEVAWIVATAAATTLGRVIDLMSLNVFSSVRERLSQHLLDLAVQRGAQAIVDVDQQQLADAIGSVREVVARALRSMEDDGLIQRRYGMIVLLDMERLADHEAR